MDVIIDGVRYAPMTSAFPGVVDVWRVLAEQWWGVPAPEEYSNLRVIVSGEVEDQDSGESFEEFAARLASALARP